MSSEHSTDQPWVSRVLLLGLAGLALLYAATSLAWPIGWDQGIMAWVGSVVESGGLPFQDAWDPKGPASYLPFATASAVGGQLPVSYRVVELMLLLGGALATGAVVRRLGLRKGAVFASFALALTQPSLGFQNTLQPDQWAGWLLVAVVAITLGNWRAPGLGILAGGLVGLATLIKPQYVLLLLIPLGIAWTGEERLKWKRLWLVLGGAAVPVLACLVWFGSHGGLDALLDGYILANLEARLDAGGQILPFEKSLPMAATAMPYLLPLALSAAIGLVACWKQNPRTALLLLTWLVLTLAGLALQARWFPYVWTPVIPPLVVLGITGLADLVGPGHAVPAISRRVRLVLAGGLGLSAAVLASLPLARESRAVASSALGRIDRMQYLTRYREGGPNFSAAEVTRAAEYLARVTAPNDCVLVWPEPGVNVLANRRTPARFATVAALTRYERSERRQRYQEEFLFTLTRNPPRLILIDSMATTNRPAYVGDLVNRFPEFLRLVHERYDLAGTVGKYSVWAPKSLVPARCS